MNTPGNPETNEMPSDGSVSSNASTSSNASESTNGLNNSNDIQANNESDEDPRVGLVFPTRRQTLTTNEQDNNVNQQTELGGSTLKGL
jgi:hypothetical protein